MATEFTLTTAGTFDEDNLAFVRFFGGTARGVTFEFGTLSNFERVCAALRAGETLVLLGGALAGDPATADDLEALVVAGRVTFGEFPVTVSVGSGNLFTFTEEADMDLSALRDE